MPLPKLPTKPAALLSPREYPVAEKGKSVKPLALICDLLLDASSKGDIVADPFGGSGTTLIAAEKLGRAARLIELDPAYCDTIIRRWQHWTGEAAVRAADEMAFPAIETQSEGGE